MNANAQRIKERYNPERDIARGSDGRPIYVTWTERALLDMIEEQQSKIDSMLGAISGLIHVTMTYQVEIDSLKTQCHGS